mmetsp:Transcript_18149/g.27317  ORF Transcript_18149/g.27317 Transcript_18149/m.27317 type:complete len:309 (+) Transcript_18149:151-1077(+)
MRLNMPRLKVAEAEQHGSSTGARKGAPKPARGRGRRQPPKPLGHGRASRMRATERTESGHKRRHHLTSDEQAAIILRYKELPQGKRQKSPGLDKIAADFNVAKQMPAKLVKRLKNEGKLPTRKGVGGRPRAMTLEKKEELKKVLKELAFDLTFRQIEELTGIPSSTASRFMKEDNGWRLAGKSCKPYLTEANVKAREAWAKKHKKNQWKGHVDIDEKWFNVYSHSGKLKLPPGVQKPRTPVKSKRFIGKVMSDVPHRHLQASRSRKQDQEPGRARQAALERPHWLLASDRRLHLSSQNHLPGQGLPGR